MACPRVNFIDTGVGVGCFRQNSVVSIEGEKTLPETSKCKVHLPPFSSTNHLNQILKTGVALTTNGD